MDAWIQDFTSRGGKARAKGMTAEERSESAKKAATAKWADVPATERSRRMRVVIEARWAKKKKTGRVKRKKSKEKP